MGFVESVLEKRGIRSDRIWTVSALYKSPLNRLPIFMDTFALLRSQYWSPERMLRYQRRRLSALLHDAQKIPVWRELMESAGLDMSNDPIAELSKLPVVSKRHLTDRPLSDIADESLLAKSDGDHTSGSTGKPFHFYHDWFSSLRSYAVTERVFRTMTGGRRYPVVYVRSRERNGFTPYRHLWFFVRGFNAIRHRMDEFEALAKKYRRGFILYGYASWVKEIADRMNERGLSLPVSRVVVAGEHISDHDKDYIAHTMRAELYELYASREVGFLGYECEEHKMHVSEEWAFVEIVDDAGVRLPRGEEGRIVVSIFDNRVMPFIRYELGDIGVLEKDPCTCGRTVPTLRFKGRVSEMIEMQDGRTVTLLDISYALGTYRDSIQQYQIIQHGPLLFVFKVIPGPAFDANKEYIEQLMVRLMHPDVQLRWELADEIPAASSGKAQYFVRDIRS